MSAGRSRVDAKLRADLHPSLFTFLQNRHSLRNRRAKARVVSDWGRFSLCETMRTLSAYRRLGDVPEQGEQAASAVSEGIRNESPRTEGRLGIEPAIDGAEGYSRLPPGMEERVMPIGRVNPEVSSWTHWSRADDGRLKYFAENRFCYTGKCQKVTMSAENDYGDSCDCSIDNGVIDRFWIAGNNEGVSRSTKNDNENFSLTIVNSKMVAHFWDAPNNASVLRSIKNDCGNFSPKGGNRMTPDHCWDADNNEVFPLSTENSSADDCCPAFIKRKRGFRLTGKRFRTNVSRVSRSDSFSVVSGTCPCAKNSPEGKSWKRVKHYGGRHCTFLTLAILFLFCRGAMATVSASASPPVSSSPSARPFSTESLPSSPWPSAQPTPSTAEPLRPPWEDDPCGEGKAAISSEGSIGLAPPWVRMEVTHEVFDVGSLVPGLVYGVSIEWPPGVQMGRLVVTSRADGSPSGAFTSFGWRKGRPSSPGIVTCTGAAVLGTDTLRDRSSFVLNWTLPAVGSQVHLRINYIPLEPALTESSVVTAASDLSIGVLTQSYRLLSVCELSLSKVWGTLSWKDIEAASSAFGGGDCTVHFPTPFPSPTQPEPNGLLVELTRLNVACSLGHLQFGPSARHVYCGKLEEYRPSERQVHMRGDERPFLRVHSRVRVAGPSGRGRSRQIQLHPPRLQVSFSLRYRPVEPCYNVSLMAKNGSFLIPPPSSSSFLFPPFRQPSDRVRCTLVVHLPFGYKVQLNLRLLGSAPREESSTSLEAAEDREEEDLNKWRGGEEEGRGRMWRREVGECKSGVMVGAWEEGPWWSKCLSRENGMVTETSEGNRVTVKVYWSAEKQLDGNELPTEVISTPASLILEYTAVEIPAIVGDCGFGWVSLTRRIGSEAGRWGAENRRKRRVEGALVGGGGFQGRKWTCVGSVEGNPLPWGDAEAECVRLGGHLASVRSEEEQAILDLMLTKSPGYREHNSYWVGASDVVREGDFRWTDGAEFYYSNWFPGWASHGHYNRQPNDDGLSGQDCVELRRAYQLPATPPPVSPHRPQLPKPPSSRHRSLWPPPPLGDVVPGGEDVPPHRLSATYAWNDRDCSAANYYVCEKEASPPTVSVEGKGVGGGRESHPSGAEVEDTGNPGGGEGGRGEDTRPGGGGRHHDCNREIRLGGGEKKASKGDGEGAAEGEGAEVLMAGSSTSSAIVTSPNFPAPYPDDVRCDTLVTAPPGYRLLLEFEELVLEDEPTCSYDYLEIQDLGPKGQRDVPEDVLAGVGVEEDERGKGGEGEEGEVEGGVRGSNGVGSGRRLCGDWSSRLKLLRHVTSGRSLRLRFVSDYSHRFGGFRARVSMLSAATIECADNRLQPFNNSCYLFVGYPEVTWKTAQQICHGMKAELASVQSPAEYRFITSSIRGSDQYSNSAIYWLGGKLQEKEGEGKEWRWVDGSPMDFQAWLPESLLGPDVPPPPSSPLCLGVRWRQSPSPRLHPSGLHWSAEKCSTVGGYVCKRKKGWMGMEPPAKGSPTNAGDLPNEYDEKAPDVDSRRDADLPTVSLKGESGVVTSPGFPEGYPPDVRALVRIEGPPRARLFLRFTALDLEEQPDCLYDYVEVREMRKGSDVPTRAERWCGSHSTDLERFDFVSDTNVAEVFFRSDYSVSGAGFSAMWHAVDVSGCPSQTLAASSAAAGETSGVLTSPNHPMALIPRLDCSTTLLAPTGRHVWLEFSESEVVEGGEVELWLGASGRRPFRPFSSILGSESSSEVSSTVSPIAPAGLRHLGDGVFLSAGNRMVVRLWTGDNPRGRGFKASFRAVDSANAEEHVIVLGNDTHGPLLHLNYPDEPPPNIHFIQRLLAPIGHVVRIRLQDVAVSSSDGGGTSKNPPQTNSTTTEIPTLVTSTIPSCESPPHLEVMDRYADTGGGSSWMLCHSLGSVLSLTSYLNSLTVVQKPVSKNGMVKDSPKLNAVVRVVVDPNYKMKLLRISEHEMRNKENPPASGAVTAEGEVNSRAGGVESCHPNPCLHGGKCVGAGQSGRKTCQCKGHYTGLFCALTMCDLEPCVFGVCVLSGDGESGGLGFTCRCFPGYTGTVCDERPRPCADNPCEGRGDCLEKGPHSFVCRCHAWWEGTRCERRMLRIPYKPLSERMLHEPFWLGLITVTVVLGIIGLIWCAKRHFPEKLEKLLAEEADRSRHGVSASSSARDNLQSLGGPQPYGVAVEGSHHHHHHQAHPGGQQPPVPSRSLFGRLGIRKPSLLSLTGGGGTSAQMQQPQLAQPTQPPPCPNNTPAVPDRKPNAPAQPNPSPNASSQHGSGGTQNHLPSTSASPSSAARTFSLDDLLKLPPRRSPSSRKKRNNSSPTRKHSITPSGPAAATATAMAEDEKKKILQSLVTPAHKPILSNAPRLSITSLAPSETLVMGECPPSSGDTPSNVSETKFMGEVVVAGTSVEEVVLEEPLPGPPLMPPVPITASRLDKKVTFARLLSRVSAEMGSSSASGSGSEAAPAPKTQENPIPTTESQPNPHLPSPASDESSSVSSSTSSSSYHAMASSGTSPASSRKSSRTKIQVPVVDALGISSTRGPSILLEPPSSSMCNMDFPPLSPIREMPSPYPSPTKVGMQSKEERKTEVRKMKGEEDTGDTDDVEEEEEDEEHARVCVTQSPEEEGGGGDGGGEEDEGEEEDDEAEDEDGEDEDDEDDDDDETEDDEEDEEDEEEQEGKAEEDHIHHKQRTFSIDAAALEATDEDIGDEGLEEDSPTGADTMSETTSASAEKCSVPKLVPLLSLPTQPIVIPTITVQQPSPTKAMTPNNRPHMMLPIGSPPPRRRLSEHHPYPPPIFFHPPLSPQVSQPSNKRLLLHGPDKPTSLDLPMSPPIITVTATMSESDETEDGCAGNVGRCDNSSFRTSGSGTIGPSGRRLGEDNSKCGGQPGMTYLSPFSMCSRGERTASESNLSSSGYSSMASPGPSRAGSNNPLCPSDVTDAEDPHQHLGGHPHHGPHLLLPHHRTGQLLHPHYNSGGSSSTLLHPSVQHHHQHLLNVLQAAPNSPTCSENDAGTLHLSVPPAYSWTRRPSPLLQTPNMEDTTAERPPESPPMAKSIALRQPQASGGEEGSAEFERSSADEEVERKGGEVREGKVWRRRRGERRNSSTTPDSNDEGIGTEGETGKAANSTQKTLQLPSIVVGVRGASPPPAEPEANSSSRLSPVSSRSESPLSDRVSLPSSSPFGHNSSPRPFSALFFGKGPPLPLTDSDALYDCPSSEVLGGDDSSTGGHTAHTKAFPFGLGLPPPHPLTGTTPGKGSNLLEVPHRQGLQRKISPKRRVRAPVPICSSSSSSSSLEGIHSKRPSTSSTYVQQSSKHSSSSEKNASKSIEVPYTTALQSPTKLHHYPPRKYKHLRGWVSPGTTDPKKCFEGSISPHGLSGITLSPNASSSSAATTPLPHDDVNVTGDATSEIIGKDTKWIYGPDKVALHEALMLPLSGQDPLPQTRKICRMKTIGHQIRFLRRLELTLKRRERLVSPSDSDEGPHKADDDDEHDRKEDSSQSSSETTKVPLLQSALPRSKEGRYRSSFRRQRRAYERSGRGNKMIAPVLEPLLHQAPLSTSSEDEEDKPNSHSSPYRQRHLNHPSMANSSAIGVITVPNVNR